MQVKLPITQDNGKLMLWLAISAIITANVFLGILGLVFRDGIASEAANLFQQEITWLIPTSGVVVTLQHFVTQFFSSKQAQQVAQQVISDVSRETQQPVSSPQNGA